MQLGFWHFLHLLTMLNKMWYQLIGRRKSIKKPKIRLETPFFLMNKKKEKIIPNYQFLWIVWRGIEMSKSREIGFNPFNKNQWASKNWFKLSKWCQIEVKLFVFLGCLRGGCQPETHFLSIFVHSFNFNHHYVNKCNKWFVSHRNLIKQFLRNFSSFAPTRNLKLVWQKLNRTWFDLKSMHLNLFPSSLVGWYHELAIMSVYEATI